MLAPHVPQYHKAPFLTIAPTCLALLGTSAPVASTQTVSARYDFTVTWVDHRANVVDTIDVTGRMTVSPSDSGAMVSLDTIAYGLGAKALFGPPPAPGSVTWIIQTSPAPGVPVVPHSTSTHLVSYFLASAVTWLFPRHLDRSREHAQVTDTIPSTANGASGTMIYAWSGMPTRGGWSQRTIVSGNVTITGSDAVQNQIWSGEATYVMTEDGVIRTGEIAVTMRSELLLTERSGVRYSQKTTRTRFDLVSVDP